MTDRAAFNNENNHKKSLIEPELSGLGLVPKELSSPPADKTPSTESPLYTLAQGVSGVPTGRFAATKKYEINNEVQLDKTWKAFKNNPLPAGLFNDLNTWMTASVKRRVAIVNGKDAVSRDGDATANLRDNLRQLRLAEKDRINDPYLTEPMREYDFSFLAIGTLDLGRPTGFSNESLAGIELQRLSNRSRGYVEGVTPDVDTQEVLSTIVFENLQEFFPIEKPWTSHQKEIARQKLQQKLQLNKHDFEKDLERLHNRFLVSAIFAKTDETGRKYGAIFKRDLLNRFVINNWGRELKVTTVGSGWSEADKKNVALKYGVTGEEADLMHMRVKDMHAGKVVK